MTADKVSPSFPFPLRAFEMGEGISVEGVLAESVKERISAVGVAGPEGGGA